MRFTKIRDSEYELRVSNLPQNYTFEISYFGESFATVNKYGTTCVIVI